MVQQVMAPVVKTKHLTLKPKTHIWKEKVESYNQFDFYACCGMFLCSHMHDCAHTHTNVIKEEMT